MIYNMLEPISLTLPDLYHYPVGVENSKSINNPHTLDDV